MQRVKQTNPLDRRPSKFRGSSRRTRILSIGRLYDGLFLLCVLLISATVGMRAQADSRAIGFENPPYVDGSIDTQDGWAGQGGGAINPSIDQAVTSAPGVARSGSRAFRMSSSYSSGSFGDWAFSPSLVDEAGETSAVSDGLSGGARKQRFNTTVYFKSATGSVQDTGVTLSPDRGDGARMSWIRISDHSAPPNQFYNDTRTAAGLSVGFYDYQVPANVLECDSYIPDTEGKCFVFHTVATGLSRTAYHRLDIEVEFYDGSGNDVVRITVDGVTSFRGTTWEDYFRNQETNPTRPVDSILFRHAGAGVGDSGNGILLDDLSYESTACLAAPRFVTTTGDDTLNDCRESGAPCETVQHAVDVACAGDTVNVAAGTYAERLNVNKRLTLSGAGVGVSILDATSFVTAGSVIQITALTGNTKIQDLDIILGGHSNGIVSSGGTDAAGKIEILNTHIIGTDLDNGDDEFGIIAGYGDVRRLVISGNEISNTFDNSILVEKQMGATDITGNTLNGAYPTIWFMTYAGDIVTPRQFVSGNTIDMSTADPGTGGSGVAFNPSSSFASPGSRYGRYTEVVVSNNIITGLGDLSFKGISIGESSPDGSGGVDSLTISGNTISGTNGKGIQLYGHIIGADIQGNTLTGLFQGFKSFSYLTAFAPAGTNLECNRIDGNATGVDIVTGDVTASTNSIRGNGVGLSNTPPGLVNAENNWWGCVAGPGNPGCDTVTGNVDFTPWATAVPVCVNCANDADCDDGLACTGSETCNLSSVCAPGVPIVCTDQCETGVCAEPSGTCVPKPNGTNCTNPADVCPSDFDQCVAGSCLNDGGGGDTDSDGVCQLDDNCPLVSNPGPPIIFPQSDIDEDGLGDICDADSTAGSLVLSLVKLKISPRLTRATGLIQITGVVNTKDTPNVVVPPPGAPPSFQVAALANAITLRITDSATYNVLVPLTNCRVWGPRGSIICKSADRKTSATFKARGFPGGPLPSPYLGQFSYAMALTVSGLSQGTTGATVPVGPLHVQVKQGLTVTRSDMIGDLSPCTHSSTTLKCK